MGKLFKNNFFYLREGRFKVVFVGNGRWWSEAINHAFISVRNHRPNPTTIFSRTFKNLNNFPKKIANSLSTAPPLTSPARQIPRNASGIAYKRFLSRVADFGRGRCHYPLDVAGELRWQCSAPKPKKTYLPPKVWGVPAPLATPILRVRFLRYSMFTRDY